MFEGADQKLAERAEKTSSTIVARGDQLVDAMTARAREIAEVFETADEKLAARARKRPAASLRAVAKAGRGHGLACPKSQKCSKARTSGSSPAPSRRRPPGIRAGDILRNFDDADQRLSLRIGRSAEALAARAAELGQIFNAADDKLVTRIAEGAEKLETRAGELGRI